MTVDIKDVFFFCFGFIPIRIPTFYSLATKEAGKVKKHIPTIFLTALSGWPTASFAVSNI